MNIRMKKSHCFAFAVFGGAAGSLAVALVMRAAAGTLDWSELPAILMLTTLASGLLAILFNLAWLQVRKAYLHLGEESSDYAPTKEALGTAATAFAAVSLLSAAPAEKLQSVLGAHSAVSSASHQVR